ncbi:MAG: acyl-ACP--UDP-N-acetylglucosamine O-acyltransferase [Candidatus Sumerlaeia bacterium]|nr:acyl-ACP--UDP-N-acetylglucosamine O-acyltransferase [Candidatus Sumerlaeia bacterium]
MAIHKSAQIHPAALVDPSAEIGENVIVHAQAIVEADTHIGAGCVLMPGTVICRHTRIGKNNRIHYGAIIGGDPQFIGFKTELVTGVEMGDNNEIREHATINRSIYEGKNTVVGSNVMMMINSHAGHDCVLGDNVVVANNTLLAGHCVVGRRAFVSGNVAVHQFCRIGEFAMVGGAVGVDRDVPPYVLTNSGGGLAFVSGLNLVGLRRGGIVQSTRTMLKELLKRLLKTTQNRQIALELADEYLATVGEVPAEARNFVEFFRTPAKRGFIPGRPRRHVLMEEQEEEAGSSA